MQVELRHVKPNPYRNLPQYPIDKAKIERLKSSINRSGFWDNIVARKCEGNGDVEIAYGHHRRFALLDMYPPSHKIDVILRELGDGDMIKVMADENDEAYNMTPAIINETVRAARDYLHSSKGEAEYTTLRRSTPSRKDQEQREGPIVAKFLDWEVERVEEALAEIAEIEDPKLSEPERQVKKEIIEKMPTQHAARVFRRKAKKHKTPIEAQREVAERVHKGEVGTADIAPRLIDATYAKKEAQKRKQLSQAIDETTAKVNAAAYALNRLAKFRDDVNGPLYHSERVTLVIACDRAIHSIAEVLRVAKKELPRLK